jgi:hypothetical protein
VLYSFDTLHKKFVFKFALLQLENILGILYLEIPFKYKFSKKFKVNKRLTKIDDWFPVKPFDKCQLQQVDSLVARIVIDYDANCKLSPKDYDNAQDVEGTN